MKPRLSGIWLITLLLLMMFQAEAQYRNGYSYGGRPNSIIPDSNDQKPEPKALTAEEIVENEMPKITETAQLNPFEEAVVSSILTKYIQQRIELSILDLEPQKTKEKIDQIRKNQNEELKAGLPEDKYQLILEIQEKGVRKTKSKKKKGKKDKKNKE